jgi:glucose/arabinose dehydrogenase
MYNKFTLKRNIPVLLFVFASVPFLLSLKSFAQTPPNLIYSPVITSGLSSPLDVVNAGDGTNRLFIVQRAGTVRIVSGGVLLPGNFLDIFDSLTSGGERGLLSIAFHPNFSSNRYFFVYYTNTDGNIRITRFQTQVGNANAADENTGVVIFTILHPSFSNHNGGKLNFGADGNLYFGTGDGGSNGDPNNMSQNGNSLLGKMIRLNVDNFTTPPYYTIPSDNPYIGNPAVRDEIFAIGLRNPWRWSFDRLNQNVWIADVGEGNWEEVNYRLLASSGGINYGWRCYEGTHGYNTSGCLPQSSYISPIFEYPHSSSTGGFSITGGYVYRGTEFPGMYGWYICADYVSGNTWRIKPNGSGGWITAIQTGLPGSISGFGEAENGTSLYALSLNGSLYRVTTNTPGPVPVTLLVFTAKAFNGYNELRWKTVNEQSLLDYNIEFSMDGANYISAGKVNAVNTPLENNYTFPHFITGFTKLFYRLKITDRDGRLSYSGIVIIDKKETKSIRIYPNLITDNRLNIVSSVPVEQVTLFSGDGRNVFQSRLNNVTGSVNILLPDLQTGFYMLRVKLKDEYFTEKIFIRQKN